ncbi:methyltransferase type 12 [Meridianimarinicoccus roseus]|uniref:Methyltransferase type 12 n=1 Tax=Meridianimarinicoccus roseus TaxID=2072018 RepID=A0A2V2LIH2_9RHOB|nr:class I SAM-dependent methyltransferase [Meridianimarinicoccus roseus]PWR03364.1 methyltransferase type 12 [Meridianimarinicoccus roseus]
MNDAYEGDNGRALADKYQAVPSENLYKDVLDCFPTAPSAILDIGAGSGRDAAWLAEKGHDVLAVEPSATMREAGQRQHPDARITWLAEQLPGLEAVLRFGASFDLILLSAVWQHVAPTDRVRAFRKVVGLLKPGGSLIVSLRLGPPDRSRGMHSVSVDEVAHLARAQGIVLLREVRAEDQLGRPDITWATLVLKLPDDGTGALPLLRHVILNDQKSSTYKLGLLRALARAADSAQGLARITDEETVELPLGLIALNWVRLYKPLIDAGLPQTPGNRGTEGLGFVGETWSGIREIAAIELRVGASFAELRAKALHGVLRDAATTITRMPATFMTYPGSSEPILPTRRGRTARSGSAARLDASYLWSFGEMRVPLHLWRALARFDAWIEPALIAEWTRVMEGYAMRQGRRIDPGLVAAAMAWHDPGRNVSFARRRALQLVETGDLKCVWTGQSLRRNNIDIDHCFPFSAWPCEDLWNLLPSSPSVNRHGKRARLPSADTLERSAELIQSWWSEAWLAAPTTAERFLVEARASLPVGTTGDELTAVFAGLQARRFAIRADHQVAEWRSSSA